MEVLKFLAIAIVALFAIGVVAGFGILVLYVADRQSEKVKELNKANGSTSS